MMTEQKYINKIKRLEAEISRLKEKLDFQNMPNKRGPTRGGYEFYINEEWTCVRNAALDDQSVDCVATLMKVRIDPDDERVRIRKILDDDAILCELGDTKQDYEEAKSVIRKMIDALKLADYELALGGFARPGIVRTRINNAIADGVMIIERKKVKEGYE